MKRRKFNKLTILGSLSLTIPTQAHNFNDPKISKPLKKGDKIGLITPAFKINKPKLNLAVENIKKLGFVPYYSKNISKQNGYLAGSDEDRISDIHKMYADKSIKGIWCVDGGYGTTRIIDYLDYDLIKRNRKPIIGFSDITALLQSIYKHTNNPCFHGPNIGYELTKYEKLKLAPIYGLKKPFLINSYEGYQLPEDEIYNRYTLNYGSATGKLIGGNLSLLVSLVGTNHEINFKDSIVFIEDIGEEPYRIDRMLTQLISADFFVGVKGILLGIFHNCERKEDDTQTLKEVLSDRLKKMNVPIMYGFSFSHVKNQCTLPIGVKAILDTNTQTLKILEDVY